MHDPTTLNRQHNDVGTQYRSAIFYTSEAQRQTAEQVEAKWGKSGKFSRPITTELTAATKFYPAEAYHQKYLVKNPGGLYLPRFARLRQRSSPSLRARMSTLAAASHPAAILI
jgi:methionine-S-sulfoxide reductase